MTGKKLTWSLRVFIVATGLAILSVMLASLYFPQAAAQETSATWEVQSDCTEATSNLTRKNYATDGATNGTCAVNSPVANKPAFRVTTEDFAANRYAYFDVSSTFISGNQYPYAQIDVEYFDGAYGSDGNTFFLLQYQSTTDLYTSSSQKVYLNNTQTYVTATFYLTNVKFDGGQNAGSDFRINLQGAGSNSLYFRKITVTRSTTPLAPSYASASTVSYQAPWGPDGQLGLYLVNAPSGHTATDSQYGRTGTRVSNETGAGYAFFSVDDSFIYQGSYAFASVEISYFDKGSGNFRIEYDAAGADHQSSAKTVILTDSNQWITRTFYLSQVYFGNRQGEAGGAGDFRVTFIPDSTAYRLVFDRIVIRRSNTDLTPSYADASNVSFQSPAQEAGLYVVTTAGEKTSTNTSFGRTATQVSAAGYAHFDVDDTFVKNGSYGFASVEVEYYDRGRGQFLIEYDATGDASTNAYRPIASKDRAFLTNSSTWLTHTFYLTDTYFGNRQQISLGDFRITFITDTAVPDYNLVFDQVTVRRSTTDLTPSYGTASSVSFRSPNLESGLRVRSVGDNPVSTTLITDTQGISRTATQVSSNGYAFFDVDDSFIYDGSYKYAAVEVSYFDQGYGFFYLTYDSNSTLASDPTAAQSFDVGLQSNNVAYLTNSRTWKTYNFYLANVKFANRQLVSLADFQLVYPLGGNAVYANQVYTLAFDQVTVTRSSSAPDRTAALVGNYPGFGDPVVVWTRLAQANEEGHGLWQNNSVGDGGATAATQGGQQSRRNSPGGYIYFDVNDNYIKNGNAYNVWVTVEYFDNSTNTFLIEYDSTSNAHKPTESVPRTGTNTWKRYTFYLNDAYFGNRQSGGSDFRITAPAKDLYVKGIYVQRAPGSLVRPRLSSLGAVSYLQSSASSERVVAAHYFAIFDYYYPSLWEATPITPTATLNQGYPVGYSWRSVETLRRDLEDMKAANVDMALVWYQGNTSDGSFGGVQAVRNLVAAAQQVTGTPKIGLFLDGVHNYTEKVLKEGDALPDATTSLGKSLYFKLVESFYSLVPSSLWATINGRPLIVAYAPQGEVSNWDASTIQFLYDSFERSFGVRPYVIADIQWDSDGSKGIRVDEFFSWGAAGSGPGYSGFWNSTAEVGPGFKEAQNPTPGQPPRERSREDGAFYQRSWAPVIARGPHIAFIETWNYWVEGSGIADSIQYGRQYITATAQLAQAYKSTSYRNAATASVTLGSTNTNSGLYQDEMSTAATTPVTIGGQTGRKAAGDNIFFSVHDSFIYRAYFPVDITVEYYDGDSASGGTDWFAIQYDSTGGAFYPPSITQENSVDIVNKGNTRTWKTKTFHFNDAYFGNRQDNRNDLVLKNPGGLIVRQVTITRPAILDLPNKVYVPFLAKSSSGGW